LNLLAKSKGFTMIEILVALVLLSISLLALAGLMAMTSKNTSSGGHMTEAATFAQDKLEELRVTPWASVATGNDTRAGSTGTNYGRTWTVAANAAGNLRTVTIAVSWTDEVSHSISLMSAIPQ
jgi:type IV pilus modification protein PilV